MCTNRDCFYLSNYPRLISSSINFQRRITDSPLQNKLTSHTSYHNTPKRRATIFSVARRPLQRFPFIHERAWRLSLQMILCQPNLTPMIKGNGIFPPTATCLLRAIPGVKLTASEEGFYVDWSRFQSNPSSQERYLENSKSRILFPIKLSK